VSDRPNPAPPTLGFLTVIQDANGYLGGYLVTNSWGRPLEFRLTTAVQPNRVQQILYGSTLDEYVHSDLIGRTLVEKTPTIPSLIVTDTLSMLPLRSRVEVPVVTLDSSSAFPGTIVVVDPRNSQPLLYPASHPADRSLIEERLALVDPVVDLTEPFQRIREAVAEARKMGVTSRAA
jgi:hypothetical protein